MQARDPKPPHCCGSKNRLMEAYTSVDGSQLYRYVSAPLNEDEESYMEKMNAGPCILAKWTSIVYVLFEDLTRSESLEFAVIWSTKISTKKMNSSSCIMSGKLPRTFACTSQLVLMV
jgi:hypothetical protein